MFFLCPFELYYLQIHKNVNCLTAVWKKSLKHIVFNLSCSSQSWPKNRLYVPSGTLTSCLSCSLSPYLFFPCLGLHFQRKFNFCSRSTLIIPGLTGLYCLTHIHKKNGKGHRGRVTTLLYEGNPGEPPQRLLSIPARAIWSAASSEVRADPKEGPLCMYSTQAMNNFYIWLISLPSISVSLPLSLFTVASSRVYIKFV